MQLLSTFTRVPEEGDDLETQFGKLMREMAKAHYGEDFEFTKCIIELDAEAGVDITTFDMVPCSDFGNKLRSFESPITEEQCGRIAGE